jgi:hypothetical protein
VADGIAVIVAAGSSVGVAVAREPPMDGVGEGTLTEGALSGVGTVVDGAPSGRGGGVYACCSAVSAGVEAGGVGSCAAAGTEFGTTSASVTAISMRRCTVPLLPPPDARVNLAQQQATVG